MLSNSAFNALLKTLEEPPGHVKFIFATTEIKKIPLTILSRVNRFDLKKLENVVLINHLIEILQREGLSAEKEALKTIAREAEGSVRDALSLLDRALLSLDDNEELSLSGAQKIFGHFDKFEGNVGEQLGKLMKIKVN